MKFVQVLNSVKSVKKLISNTEVSAPNPVQQEPMEMLNTGPVKNVLQTARAALVKSNISVWTVSMATSSIMLNV